jgi:hypothetical protein
MKKLARYLINPKFTTIDCIAIGILSVALSEYGLNIVPFITLIVLVVLQKAIEYVCYKILGENK